jgi:Flp pilus assembly protein TadG
MMLGKSRIHEMQKKLRATFSGFHQAKGGNIVIMFGLTIIPIITAAGMAVDFGNSRYIESQIQTAGDMGVLAAAASRAAGGGDDSDTVSFGKKVFNENKPGYGGGAKAVASITWDANIVTLAARTRVPSPFLSIINNDTIAVATISKAAYGPPTKACIVALNRTVAHAIQIHGSSGLEALKCAVWSNSGADISTEQAGTSTAKAAGFCTHGRAKGEFSPPPRSHCARVADPFENISLDDSSTMACDYNNVNVKKSDGPVTLTPGVYCGGIDIMTDADVTLDAGTFHIIGQLIVRSHATLTGAATVDGGNTLIFYGEDGGFYTNGAGIISLNAPPDGQPYAGMAIIGDGENVGYENTMNGGAGVKITGTVYLPKQAFKVNGSITVEVDAPEFTIVADTVDVGGGSKLLVEADNDTTNLPDNTLILSGAVLLVE